jgi:hypothetical protein
MIDLRCGSDIGMKQVSPVANTLQNEFLPLFDKEVTAALVIRRPSDLGLETGLGKDLSKTAQPELSFDLAKYLQKPILVHVFLGQRAPDWKI